MEACCRDFRYRFSQFKVIFELAKAGHNDPAIVAFNDVQQHDLDVYQRAFERRCEGDSA